VSLLSVSFSFFWKESTVMNYISQSPVCPFELYNSFNNKCNAKKITQSSKFLASYKQLKQHAEYATSKMEAILVPFNSHT
jgi:hypothetical protein